MLLCLDEHIPGKILRYLQVSGYQAEYIQRAVADREILSYSHTHKAILITADMDFQRLVIDEQLPTSGVICLRIASRISLEHRAHILVNLLQKYADKLDGAFAVLSESSVDIRRPLR